MPSSKRLTQHLQQCLLVVNSHEYRRSMSSIKHKLYAEVGLKALVHSPTDTKILCLQRLVRLLAYGSTSLILVLYLASLAISEENIGLFMTLTLLGDVVISLMLTTIADGNWEKEGPRLRLTADDGQWSDFRHLQQLLDTGARERAWGDITQVSTRLPTVLVIR